jgi:hypothetical protein
MFLKKKRIKSYLNDNRIYIYIYIDAGKQRIEKMFQMRTHNMLLEYFERNIKGELFKTCNRCRKKKPQPIDILIGGISTAINGANDDTISTTTPESSDNSADNVSTTTPETNNNLVGENREFGGNLLSRDLIPRRLWFLTMYGHVSVEAHGKNCEYKFMVVLIINVNVAI